MTLLKEQAAFEGSKDPGRGDDLFTRVAYRLLPKDENGVLDWYQCGDLLASHVLGLFKGENVQRSDINAFVSTVLAELLSGRNPLEPGSKPSPVLQLAMGIAGNCEVAPIVAKLFAGVRGDHV